MKRRIQFSMLALALTLLGASCNDSAGPGGDSSKTTTVENTIGGVPASTYYKNHFAYTVLGSCEDPNTVSWRYFSEFDPFGLVKVGQDDEGRDKVSSVSLALLPDGTYHGTYKEMSVLSQQGGVTEMREVPDSEKQLSGTWKVDELALVVSGIGRGTAWTFNDDELVHFKVTSPELPTLVGKTIDLGAGRSNQSDTGESINHYCGLRE